MALRLLRGAPGAAKSSLLCHLRSSSSSKPGGRSEPAKQPLKKPKLPVGRFDEPEESSMEKEPLEKYILPYHVNRKPGLKVLTSGEVKYRLIYSLQKEGSRMPIGSSIAFICRQYFMKSVKHINVPFCTVLSRVLDEKLDMICQCVIAAQKITSWTASKAAWPAEFPDGINPTTKERGGPRGPEPTRFGDWERKGRCIDF